MILARQRDRPCTWPRASSCERVLGSRRARQGSLGVAPGRRRAGQHWRDVSAAHAEDMGPGHAERPDLPDRARRTTPQTKRGLHALDVVRPYPGDQPDEALLARPLLDVAPERR